MFKKEKKRIFQELISQNITSQQPLWVYTTEQLLTNTMCFVKKKKKKREKKQTVICFFVEIYLESFLIVKSFRNNNQWYVILVLLAKSFLLNFQDVVK